MFDDTPRRLVLWLIAMIPLTAIMAGAPGAGATVIYDNFDAGGGYHPTDNLSAAGATRQFGTESAVRSAAQFSVTGGDISLDSVTLPISVLGSTPGDFLRVRLAADEGGAPGTTLEVLSENQGVLPTQSNPFTTTTTLSSGTHPLLSNGTSYCHGTHVVS